jgi:hypothetical protein
VAGDPVLLPMIEFAARLACLASVTAPAAMVSASDPAVLVTSPVCAGSCAACNVPVTPVDNGNPVALVSVTEVGVPKIGVTRVGDVARTTAPVPVAAAHEVAQDPAVVVTTPVSVGKLVHGKVPKFAIM